MKRKRSLIRVLILLAFVLVVVLGVAGYNIYNRAFKLITIPEGASEYFLYIPTGTGCDQLAEILVTEGIFTDTHAFKWLADRKNLEAHINAGRYRLEAGMSHNDFVNLIRSGTQMPVKVVFTRQRTLERLASVISKQIEPDSSALMALFNNEDFIRKTGWEPRNLMALFIPNTYDLYWNSSPGRFYERMQKEYDRFWTNDRRNKAGKLGLTPIEVSTLASIIVEETNKAVELPIMASVYLNRMRKGYRLQACPTIKYAKNDFTMQRILTEDLTFPSPYNTYLHYGLPPGPITIPSIIAIDAVLNPDDQGYLYFAAKEDFSGYHYFSKTLAEHNRYAAKYQRALNKRRIYN